jgi:outer membrane protein W
MDRCENKFKKQMKKLKSNFTTIKLAVLLCVALFSLSANAQEEEKKSKNNIRLSGGMSVSVISIDYNSDNFASNGSNYSINYGREIYRSKKGYLTIDVKYLNASNEYSKLESDISEINSSFPTSLGTWSGSSDKFKMTSYTAGLNWYEYISKNQKWACYIGFYLGSGTLTSPAQSFVSSNDAFIKLKELKSNSFIYSSNVGLAYDITKSISIGASVDYSKSSLSYDNQEITFSGGSDYATPYKLKYSALNLNAELIFKF